MKNSEKLKIEKEKNPKDVIFELIQNLPERSKKIIISRFGLDGEGLQTLDKIGKDYGITRERVRQIESEAIVKLKDIGKRSDIKSVFNILEKNFKSVGGVMCEKEITRKLFKDKYYDNVSQYISLLILSLDDRIKIRKETNIYKKVYFYKTENFKNFKKVIDTLEEYLIKFEKNIKFDEMLNLLRKKGFSSLSEQSLRSYLKANKLVLQSVILEWGYRKWPHINPKSIRDKAYLTLKKNEHSLHFVKIAEEINKIWKEGKKANNQTVHNELIKDKRFVLIGRGIYTLAEWGYQTGTVLDVLLETFQKERREMSQKEVVEKVLEKREVKKNTIILNLQNKKYFKKLENKVYKLK